jgi:hypothetical protein
MAIPLFLSELPLPSAAASPKQSASKNKNGDVQINISVLHPARYSMRASLSLVQVVFPHFW